MKQCTKCNEIKKIEFFSKTKKNKDGLSAWCKMCFRENMRRHYKENKDIYLKNKYKQKGTPWDIRLCIACSVKKHRDNFKHRHKICNDCDVTTYKKLKSVARSEKQKEDRKNPKNRAYYIIADSKASDKRKGFETDLTEEFVNKCIEAGCAYCKTLTSKMSLDRIDNTKGHIKNNVTACCVRCNFIRKNMPIQAWNFLVPHIAEATKLGLFDEWKDFTNKT